MCAFRKSSYTHREHHHGKHRFEHWYRDNTVYFITARCRDRFPAFVRGDAKAIFWNRFDHYAATYDFVPWITSLLDNHYHTLGYLRVGENLGPLMQKLHGSVAKMVNDLLPQRHRPFWRTAGNKDYFDGCIRDEKQATLAYRYVQRQSHRHGITTHPDSYAHTHVNVELRRAIGRARQLDAFMLNVPYARYARRGNPSD